MEPISARVLLEGLCPGEDIALTGVVTDSRKVIPGCVFVCFPGARVDGHDFARECYDKGAAYIVVNRILEGIPEDRQILVADSRIAMLKMGANYRKCFSPTLIGVTGSVGKTTTKEFTYAILSEFGPAIKTEGNQNNEIGVPNTLFRLDSATRYGVVEMGMSHAGEIAALVDAVRPQGGLITCIGVSHIENLGSRGNILKAKMEICKGLPQGAPLALNRDDPYLAGAQIPEHIHPVWYGIDDPAAQVRAVNIKTQGQGQSFTLLHEGVGEFQVYIPTLGRHTVYDALAAYAAATGLGLDPARCAQALSRYQSTGMRQRLVIRKGVSVVEDCYNASPDSMKAALSMFLEIPGRRHVALLGDMLELGQISQQAHRQVGEMAAQAGVDLLVAYGPLSEEMARSAREQGLEAIHCLDKEEAARILCQNLEPGDALLAKASRGTALEEILALYYEQ